MANRTIDERIHGVPHPAQLNGSDGIGGVVCHHQVVGTQSATAPIRALLHQLER